MKTIGIKLADGTFYPVLEEGQPGEKTLELTTAHNNQTRVMVDLYRTETGTMEDAEYVDTLQIDNLNEHSKEDSDISFAVTLDENNELSARIVDKETGASSNTTISLVNRTLEERLVTEPAESQYEINETAVDEPKVIENDVDGISLEAPEILDDFSLDDFKESPELAPQEAIISENFADDTETLDNDKFEISETQPDEFVGDETNSDDAMDDNTTTENNSIIEGENLSDMPNNEDSLLNDPLAASILDGDTFDDTVIDDQSAFTVEPFNESSMIEDMPSEEIVDEKIEIDDSFGENPFASETETAVEETEPQNNFYTSVNTDGLIEDTIESNPFDNESDETFVDETPAEDSFGDETITEDSGSDTINEPAVEENPFDINSFGDDMATTETISETSTEDTFSEPTDTTTEDSSLSDTINEPVVEESPFDMNSFGDDILTTDTVSTEETSKTITSEDSTLADTTTENSFASDTAIENSELTSDDSFDTPTTSDNNLVDESFDLPDFGDFSFDAPATQNNFAISDSADTSYSADPFADYDSLDSSEDDSFDDFDSLGTPAKSASYDSSSDAALNGAFDFDNLFDEPKDSSTTESEAEKKTRLPVIICVLCSIICIVAVLLILFVVPSEHNLLSRETEKQTVVIEKTETPAVSEKTATTTPETPKLPPSAKENEIVIIEEAETVKPEPPKPPKNEKKEDIIYKVKWGDTLWDIADTYYKNPWRYIKIANYNGIKNPDYIITGTTILIPQE